MGKLTPKQKAFAEYYIETSNAAEAARRAGYSEKTARSSGQRLLTSVDIQEYIRDRTREMDSKRIADADEVLEYFSRVMRGEEKDQFGLDAPLIERTRAAVELAKRTVDIENKRAGETDNKLEIVITRRK